MTAVLTVNVGSSNIKLSLLDEHEEQLWARTVDLGDGEFTPAAFDSFLVGAPGF